jgi:hypothetical protein
MDMFDIFNILWYRCGKRYFLIKFRILFRVTPIWTNLFCLYRKAANHKMEYFVLARAFAEEFFRTRLLFRFQGHIQRKDTLTAEQYSPMPVKMGLSY